MHSFTGYSHPSRVQKAHKTRASDSGNPRAIHDWVNMVDKQDVKKIGKTSGIPETSAFDHENFATLQVPVEYVLRERKVGLHMVICLSWKSHIEQTCTKLASKLSLLKKKIKFSLHLK